ncbi:glutathione-disulfide reductase [Candidatus Raskinella chloraquaticus]|uniref:Glutathione reductase n=1 Tax=Candidatus Raskinella chloraquaticus TaxID=1951219 RepID=A0A1W9HX74_9HYPH|nr:MAG: glutathione-disulfide reductase [Proteobacteria bacterium SG_bin8]
MTSFDVDLFVIGGGSGGVRAARIAGGYGARVMLAEEFRLGGTCVIRGCVPKKLLVYASRFADEFADAKGFGWTVPAPIFDWPTLIANKDKEIDRLERAYGTTLANANVEVIRQRAVVDGPHTVRLADGRRVTAAHILVATGGWPQLPADISGIEHAITSNEAFYLDALPKRVVINGGGYIAVEFAGIFHGLGSEVTIVYRGDGILRGFDDDLRAGLVEAYSRRGIRILTRTRITGIVRGASGLEVALSDGSILPCDKAMFATGRIPHTGNLGLETAGVELDGRGAVKVDAFSRSSIPSIYAVGDVTDRVNLTPVAIREGHAFADTVFGKHPVAMDHRLIPSAVFSTPELGTVGLTETQAAAAYPVIDVYKTSFRTMKATLSGSAERMMMKLLVDGVSDRVVGAHILGPDAGEMAQLLGVLLKAGATKRDFDQTCALHPSAAEELVTMRKPTARLMRS